MKKLVYIFVAFVLMLSACEYDNYDPPKSQLTGSFVHEGMSVSVRHNLDVLRLYEPGWQNFEPIRVNVKQDGTFSSLLFEGDYKLVLIPGNGPWVDQPDTLDVHVEGSETRIEISVEPFFQINNSNFRVNGATLTATFDLDKIIDNSELQYVSLFIGETMLLDNRFNMREERLPANAIVEPVDPITLAIDVADVEEDFVFARIGVKTNGNSELIFSQVQKIQL